MRTIGKAATPIALAVLALGGCSADTITANPDSSFDRVVAEASATVGRPWNGDCDLEAVFTSANTLLITGTCQIAHMGRTTLVQNQTIDWATGTFSHVATYTAANGDQLRMVGSGYTVPKTDFSGLLIYGTELADGGTGRFALASGTVSLKGENFFGAVLTGVYHLEGIVKY